MCKLIALTLATFLLSAFVLTIICYQKTNKVGSHEKIVEVFNNQEVWKIDKSTTDEYLGLYNLPAFIFKSSLFFTDVVSEPVSKMTEGFIKPEIMKLLVKISPYLTIIFWILWVYILVEFLLKTFVNWVYNIFMIAILLFFGMILFTMVSKNNERFEDNFVIQQFLSIFQAISRIVIISP